MAWIYLILVVVVFYTPMLDLGARLIGKDYEISALSISIHFSGSLRLLAYSLAVWYVLWGATQWLERVTKFDVFYWLDSQLGWHLRQRWLYSERPYLSNRVAKFLAWIALAASLGKIIGLDVHATLMPFSILVPIASRAYEREQQHRYQLDLKRNRFKRKQGQKEIVVPLLKG